MNLEKSVKNEFVSRQKRKQHSHLSNDEPKVKQAKAGRENDGRRLGESVRNDVVIDQINKLLPSDFFDKSASNANEKSETEAINELPKGFFDNPEMDAKARNVPYKDPKDEEWEKFQKVIAEEKNASEALIEEQFDEFQFERNLEEVDAQISNWEKLNKLQSKAEELIAKANENMSTGNDGSDEDESDVNENIDIFSDWRSKGTLIKKSS
ncbi:zinc finger protein 830-like protein [Dinothrombium tinctorium]|uniref:Zinc finger protein 830-like protein n=1 Tax=Dinothrombium tinctorium TaxID=1965070 RepID=A0A3S3PEP2_9ACAR|nr:zinc finger protein 830-like protein [Dinothrombium tinctorium]